MGTGSASASTPPASTAVHNQAIPGVPAAARPGVGKIRLGSPAATVKPGDLGYPPWDGFLVPGDTVREGAYNVRVTESVPGEGFQLLLQTDGNLVQYSSTTGRAMWATRTRGKGETLTFQRDHNVVLYSSTGRALWSTHTYRTGANKFGLTAEGDLIATTAVGNSGANTVNWDNHAAYQHLGAVITREGAISAMGGGTEALMQADGNFVIYEGQGEGGGPKAIWSTHTQGHPGANLVENKNGNLEIFSRGFGTVLWQTNTAHSGNYPTYLVMQQDDRNLVLYNSAYKPIWASGTAIR